jgi:hypothetical protein
MNVNNRKVHVQNIHYPGSTELYLGNLMGKDEVSDGNIILHCIT